MSGGKSSPIPKPDSDCFLQTKIAEVRDLLSKGYYWKAKFRARELGVLDHFEWPE